MPKGGGCALQGVPPQSAPPVCPNFLSGVPGCRKTGGCTGAFLHRDNADLSHFHRSGTCAAAGPAWACRIDNFSQIVPEQGLAIGVNFDFCNYFLPTSRSKLKNRRTKPRPKNQVICLAWFLCPESGICLLCPESGICLQ